MGQERLGYSSLSPNMRIRERNIMEDRRKCAGNKEIWVIKAGFPDTPAKKWWSEYAFSHSLKKYLDRLGRYTVIEAYDEWENEKEADVVVVLRGNREYFPDRKKRGCLYIMWNLSHPGTISDEEYNAYDLICISSKPHAGKIEKRTNVPVKILPMCADTEIFYPDQDPYADKEYDWIFVGNSRYVKRKSVTWSIGHGITLKIWGANWKGFIPDYEKYVVAENIPNDELPVLYRTARITVDDHYEDMIENGFINTRIVEAFACGLPVISDYSEVLEEMFGDAVLCYRNEEEFAEQTEKAVRDYDAVKKKVLDLWPLIQEKYSFEACSKQLVRFSEDVRNYGKECANQWKRLMQPVPEAGQEQVICEREELTQIKVSVIVSVYNTAEFLTACMDSITGQTLKEIEIICVDDGSKDSSLDILKKYAKKDRRISVYTQKNGGPSLTRNRAMEKAAGEYLYFIDSDDVLEIRALEELYQKSKESDLDILCFDGETIFETQSAEENHPAFREYYRRREIYPEVCTGAQMLTQMRRAKEYRASVVMQFFRKSFLKSTGLSFCAGILHEDNDFSFKAMLTAERAGYIHRAYYKRRIHENSVMTGNNGIEHVCGYYCTLKNMVSFAENTDFDADTQEMICDILQGMLYNLRKEFEKLTWQERSVFRSLNGAERFIFERYVGRESMNPDSMPGGVIRDMKQKLLQIQGEKAKLEEKLKRAYAEKSGLNDKLQKTYAEKSEINRKLQVTYGEKYDRGLKIKSLEKEIASIKRSRSYRLARLIGFPVRCFRKIVKRLSAD